MLIRVLLLPDKWFGSSSFPAKYSGNYTVWKLPVLGLSVVSSTYMLSVVKAWVGKIPRAPYVYPRKRLHTARCHVIAVSSTHGSDA